MIPNWFRWGGVTALLVLAGCSDGGDKWTKKLPKTVPAAGVVTLDGNPVEGAAVVFVPEDPQGYGAQALTDSSGYFELSAFPSKEGAVPGSYLVQVSKTIEVKSDAALKFDPGEDAAHAEEPSADLMWENALPEKYASAPTSGIKFQIPADGSEELKIDLKSK